jgi:hypothetical protein
LNPAMTDYLRCFTVECSEARRCSTDAVQLICYDHSFIFVKL